MKTGISTLAMASCLQDSLRQSTTYFSTVFAIVHLFLFYLRKVIN